ncbi:amidohydrolase [Shewanella sp. Choline-02u-19]|uniref:M20 metallopeptidase family protein n=1 Tax=unclassified Shewanella TaxID=196818 RepID=UPI000C321BAE|nr:MULTISPECIES: amidohydrolase [unclassified Shewanella]PKG73902.1 amidohydrolase [Shewanella sp. GutCb]PKH54896.1 amidohydrolase [Shewanella sp. Bg11-22]PKI26668.1 amidohydrolase [Shewanella sp. Choline-02u-19]
MTISSKTPIALSLCFLFTVALSGNAVAASLSDSVDKAMPKLEALYLHLHQHPELSFQEKATSARMAKELATLGFEVTEQFGGYGVVGIYRNGDGPTVMIRADTDGLPIIEETGKPYASTVTTKDASNNMVGIMHGCGHDIHMTSLIGTAEQLVANKADWKGTLMMVAQPAEEVGGGAKAMLKQGLFTQFPTPDYIIGLHVSAGIPAGKVGIAPGYALANVDSVDIKVKGKGGHGAYPHATKDPVVLASRMVLALQTISSREISPLEPNVITVGSIHGGSKHNIISDEVKLQLTLRSYNPDVRLQQIEALKRLTRGIAISAGLPDELMPEVYVHEEERIPSTYNDPTLAANVQASIEQELGVENVLKSEPVMAGEDFGLYGLTAEKRPITIFWLGAVDPDSYQISLDNGSTLPSLHSSQFAPDYPLTINTGVRAMSRSAMNLFNHH